MEWQEEEVITPEEKDSQADPKKEGSEVEAPDVEVETESEGVEDVDEIPEGAESKYGL